jgi:5-methylcytosine-specific restriction endonuclease McrA
MGRVNIVSHYDRVVRSPSFAMRLPSVVSLKSYIPAARRPAFTRFNVFLRDRFTCQYCNTHASAEDLTFDHVIPKSMGGLTMWENVVAACEPCNLRKGGALPDACADASAHASVRADRASTAGKRPGVPAQPSSSQLARLPVLGQRARSGLTAAGC